MFFKSKIQFYILLTTFALFECTTDIPCSPMQATGGYVCVCSETYCDTIHRPHPKRGHFIQYMTSEQSPGFTKKIGKLNRGISEDASNNSSDIRIKVNGSIENQTIMGFGGSITESAAIAIDSLGPGAQNNFFESTFGPTGVEYSLFRVPVAASDFSPKYYTYDDVPGDVDLNNFTLNEVDYNMKIPFIIKAQNTSKRGIKLLATPWSAPIWMKTNNKTTAGYINSKYLPVWAKYLIKFLEAYSDEGIEFWGLTQGNEVVLPVFFGSFFPIANTILLPNQARELAKLFGDMKKQSKFKDLKVYMLDDERPFMTWYSDRVFADPEVAPCVDGIALHWYFDTPSSLPLLDEFHNRYPDKDILYSESSIQSFHSSGGAVDLGDWSRAARYIKSIIKNLSHWSIGYIDWNIALNTDGGPTGPLNMTLDAQLIINMTNGEFYKQPIFYGIGHFSKFIYNGAKIINLTIEQDTTDVFKESLSLENLINSMKDSLKESVKIADISGSLNEPPPPTGGPTGTPPSGGPTDTPPTGNTPPIPMPTSSPEDDQVLALAAKNPDGTRTLIVYNPKPGPMNITVEDAQLGTFQATIQPNSINSFCYR